MKRRRRPDPPPLETDGVRAITVGTVLWALALVGLLPFYPRLAATGRGWWLWTCGVAVVLGVLAVAFLRGRRARRRTRPTR